MPKIQLLPAEIVAKIAAGEIIERPASVVKELLENSLDAKPGQIKISLRGGGLEEISVYDDGEGIEPEDLRLCVKRHATSKIKSLSDLSQILTYGFRGEALASIAEVSSLTIKSKAQTEGLAFELKVEFGKEVSFQPTPFQRGTLVSVRNLFANLPARRAFLKSKRVETAKALEIVKALMLVRESLKWELVLEGDNYLNWQGGPKQELLSYLLNVEPKFFLLQEEVKNPYHLKLTLTSQEKVYPHTRYLYFYVNDRWVKDERLTRIFMSVLKKYYGSYGYPAGLVELSLPPKLVDFNVHPAKWEVRFRREEELFGLFSLALGKMFDKKRLGVESGEGRQPSRRTDLPLTYQGGLDQTFKISEPEVASYGTFKPEKFNPPFRLIGSFQGSYILVERGEELFVVDQHALAERIIYERLKRKAVKVRTQRLLLAKTIPFDEETRAKLLTLKEDLVAEGFLLEVMKDGSLLVLGKPDYLPVEDLDWVLRETLEDYAEGLNLKEELLKRLSCTLARKKGEALPEEEKRYLLEEMFKGNFFTCPHGRPLFYKISLEEIKRKIRA